METKLTNEEKAKELIAGDEGINISTVKILIKDKVLQMAKWKDEQHNKNVKTWQLELEKKQILIGELYEQIGKLVEELHKKD